MPSLLECIPNYECETRIGQIQTYNETLKNELNIIPFDQSDQSIHLFINTRKYLKPLTLTNIKKHYEDVSNILSIEYNDLRIEESYGINIGGVSRDVVIVEMNNSTSVTFIEQSTMLK